MKKSNNVDHENLVDILKGSISYDISKVITDLLKFELDCLDGSEEIK